MKLIVCGGRAFNDYMMTDWVLNAIHRRYVVSKIASGGAAGADTIAERWAFANNVEHKKYPADWKRFGKAAGPIRNQTMLLDFRPDAVVAFAGGKGTAGMVKLAQDAGVYVYKFN